LRQRDRWWEAVRTGAQVRELEVAASGQRIDFQLRTVAYTVRRI
jgi:hypothetical protein